MGVISNRLSPFREVSERRSLAITLSYFDYQPKPIPLAPDNPQYLTNHALIAGLSSGGNIPNSEYPQSQARELFNADWAAASVFDLNPEFSDTYSQALMIAVHKDNQADAYTVFLCNGAAGSGGKSSVWPSLI